MGALTPGWNGAASQVPGLGSLHNGSVACLARLSEFSLKLAAFQDLDRQAGDLELRRREHFETHMKSLGSNGQSSQNELEFLQRETVTLLNELERIQSSTGVETWQSASDSTERKETLKLGPRGASLTSRIDFGLY